MKTSSKYLANHISKYRNKKVMYDGIKFDSIKEKNRYQQLKLLEQGGEIEGLKLQVPFTLIDKSEYGREIKYIADFTYIVQGKVIVEDTKSPVSKTPVYRLKKRLLAERYGIEIEEL